MPAPTRLRGGAASIWRASGLGGAYKGLAIALPAGPLAAMKTPEWRLSDLPVPAFVCRRDGKLLGSNGAAPSMLGTFGLSGAPSPFDQILWGENTDDARSGRALLAAALDEPQYNQRILVKRADGTRYRIIIGLQPIRTRGGRTVALLCCLGSAGEDASMRVMVAQHAAIIQNSDDAILSKDLNGTITSWNPGAQRIFGYTADEAIGKPVAMLIPQGRISEEAEILGRLRRGERIDHYETVRVRKDGSEINISLTVSPIRRPDGTIVGASKIGRDITEQHRARERQELLMREINHRVNNIFAITNAIVALSMPFAASAADLARVIRERLDALSRAQRLGRPGLAGEDLAAVTTTIAALASTIAQPYESKDAPPRIRFHGPEVVVAGGAVSHLALVIHEFAANAAKYGALSQPGGTVDLTWRICGASVTLVWDEKDGPVIAGVPTITGFGTLLSRRIVIDQFGGNITLDWPATGLVATLTVPMEKLTR